MKALRLDDVPTPLKVAASLTAVEAVVLLGYAVAELAQISSGLAGVTLTTSAFFAVYGAALLVCAWGLVNRRSWARSPVVLAQLIQLGRGLELPGRVDHGRVDRPASWSPSWSIVGVLHPASIDHLSDEPSPDA